MIWLSLALAQDTGVADAPVEPPIELPVEPRAWTAPEERGHVLGPWPDGFVPDEGFQRGLDIIDPLSGRVVEAGNPYTSGEVFGPQAPPSPQQGDPPAEVEPLPPEAPAQEPAETAVDLVEAPTEVAPTAAEVRDLHAEREIPRQLPVTPEPSFRRALIAGILAVFMLLAIRWIERGPLTRLPQRGLVPLTLRGTVVGLRVSTLAAVLIAGLMLLPKGLNPAPAYVFVGVALAVGWTARDVLRDFIAGVVLVVEHRLVVDQRVELGDHRGLIQGIGLRHVDVLDDSGQLVTIPNRVFLEATLHTDPDRFAPVAVRIHVPTGGQAGEVRRQLEELALLSPYLAPERDPEVHRDADERDVWVVRARLVDPRYAPAFRGAMVELADEVLGD